MSRPAGLIRENVKLAPLTYYKIGGPASYVAEPASDTDLVAVADFIRKENLRYFVLGAGSNVLFDDEGFDGVVLHTSKLNVELKHKGAVIEAGAGVLNVQLLRLCMTEGIAGFEFLGGVPGNLGGAICMNAGTPAGEIKSVVRSVTVFDLATNRKREVTGDELKFSYRSQQFLGASEMVCAAVLEGKLSAPKIVQEAISVILERRRKTQPVDKPSCGSVFKNPDPAAGVFAGKLIEASGLKGHRIGNAEISPLHANFIVNLGGATAADVKALIGLAKKRVKETSGVDLEEEVKIVGAARSDR